MSAALAASKDDEVEMPPPLDLAGPETAKPSEDVKQSHFKDLLAWDVESNIGDPGQAISLRKYNPINLLQVGGEEHCIAVFF